MILPPFSATKEHWAGIALNSQELMFSCLQQPLYFRFGSYEFKHFFLHFR
jgi:hypothetical protein